jgi:hypothetical protein
VSTAPATRAHKTVTSVPRQYVTRVVTISYEDEDDDYYDYEAGYCSSSNLVLINNLETVAHSILKTHTTKNVTHPPTNFFFFFKTFV